MEELIYIKDVLEIFWYGDPTVPVQKGFIQFIGLAISVASSLIGSAAAKKQANKARDKRQQHERELKAAEQGRQEIVDPSKDIKSMAGMISNPYANLQVATKAAEMQAEEADLSLASSLDTLRATGASAGGATALAQAALRSKQGISATIQTQEADNSRLRAQGQTQMQGMLMQEGARVQGAKARGQEFMFSSREKREQQQINRLSALSSNAQAQEATSRMASQQMLYQGLGQVGGALMTMEKGDFKFGGGKNQTTKGAQYQSLDGSTHNIDTTPAGGKNWGSDIRLGYAGDATGPGSGNIAKERSGFYNWITGGDGSSAAGDPLGAGKSKGRNYLLGKGGIFDRKKGG